MPNYNPKTQRITDVFEISKEREMSLDKFVKNTYDSHLKSDTFFQDVIAKMLKEANSEHEYEYMLVLLGGIQAFYTFPSFIRTLPVSEIVRLISK